MIFQFQQVSYNSQINPHNRQLRFLLLQAYSNLAKKLKFLLLSLLQLCPKFILFSFVWMSLSTFSSPSIIFNLITQQSSLSWIASSTTLIFWTYSLFIFSSGQFIFFFHLFLNHKCRTFLQKIPYQNPIQRCLASVYFNNFVGKILTFFSFFLFIYIFGPSSSLRYVVSFVFFDPMLGLENFLLYQYESRVLIHNWSFIFSFIKEHLQRESLLIKY